jgi:hypothetical protein
LSSHATACDQEQTNERAPDLLKELQEVDGLRGLFRFDALGHRCSLFLVNPSKLPMHGPSESNGSTPFLKIGDLVINTIARRLLG